MQAERAWQYALDQLQMEMPKATYDRWVREAGFASYQRGLFTIAAPSECARQWLEERLASTATRLLTGLMNRSVQVRFVVQAPPPEIEGDAEVELPASQPNQAEKKYHIELAQASLRDGFVHPQRVTVVPGYFQRWLPYLGPTLAWIVVAFRQAMFMATHQEARPEVNFSVSPASLARWAGIYRTTLWRRVDDRPLGWFVKRAQRASNVFRFVAAMPLTPGDAEALSAWLAAAGACRDPVATLEKALASASGFNLPDPAPPPTPAHLDMDPNPQSVQDVVLKACGRIGKKATLNRLLELADQLAARLMPPGDTIHITHYFLLHHLGALGAAPAWFVTLLRDRCYTGKDGPRDTVWIRGGYTEIARMLGLQRPKTVSEWLPAVFDRQAGRAATGIPGPKRGQERRILLQQFITRAEYRAYDHAACGYKVALLEPLTTEDQADYDWVIAQAGRYLETGDRGPIEALLQASAGQPAAAEWAALHGADATPGESTAAQMQHGAARAQPAAGGDATSPGAAATPAGRDCNAPGRDRNALNRLNLLVKLLKLLDLNSLTPGEPAGEPEPIPPAKAVVVEAAWNLPALFRRNPAVKAETQKTLVQGEASAPAFVSWLLYAASPGGKGISRPALFAASKLSANPQAGAGSSYDRLAALAPRALLALIASALANDWTAPSAALPGLADWQAVMAHAAVERLQALQAQLFE